MNMEVIIEENVDTADLKKFEAVYMSQERRGAVSEKTQFDYAWCLVRSRYSTDIHKGIALLEDLLHKTSDTLAQRDYLFYIAVGFVRSKEYEKALKYTEIINKIQPGNHQSKGLEEYIKSRVKKDGLLGMAIVGGAAVAVAGLIGLGIGLAKH